MLCYKDKTYCSSNTDDHNCGSVITEEELMKAEAIGLPVAYTNFCDEDKDDDYE